MSRMDTATGQDRSVHGIPTHFAGRLAIQQRVLPAYRADFFDTLAVKCERGLSVFAGLPQPAESISVTSQLHSADFVQGYNLHLGRTDQRIYACWQGGITDWLQEQQPDVLVAEANPRYLSTRNAVRWMHIRDLPVLGWGLGAPKFTGQDRGLFSVSRQAYYRMFDGMIAYSRRGAREYAAFGIPPERIFIAPNAVSHRPRGEPPDRPDCFAATPVVLYVGRLQARKRLDKLLYACSALTQEQRPRLVIIGDGPVRQELQGLAESIYPQAEFTGDVRGSALEAYFRAADLFVLPGTGGLAVQQAMGFGLPVIAAEGDGTLEDLIGPGNGWRVPPNDLPALQSALLEALSDPARLRSKGRESYRIVMEEANIEMMVAGFLKAINQISSKG